MDNQGKVLRVKKKVKPSSSCRSAELLGNQKSVFPTQIQKTLASSVDDNTIEDSADANLCVVFRKLNKKDPITKKKALEELIAVVNRADVEELIQILPLWSKIYKNLAFDPAHNVRDSTQVLHKMLALKCKRNVAPYLKHLVPVWLFSHFDNYTPAAITARSSFYDIFDIKFNGVLEVCLYCQLQILEQVYEYLSKPVMNLTCKGIDDSLDRGKLYASLEVLSFFTEHTKTSSLSPQSHVILRSILELKHYWNLGAQASKQVRTAWFKGINNLVQNESTSGIILDYKWKIIEVSFNGIDENETILSTAIWDLILQLQLKYNDWYNHVDLETIKIKLKCLFQSNFFNNFQVICPKMLTFYSSLMTAYFSESDWHMILEEYLTDLKSVFCCETLNSKVYDYKAIFNAYFDCWRFILNKYSDGNTKQNPTYLLELVHTTIIDPIKWLISANKKEASKIYFDATIQMILEWKNNMRVGRKEMFYKQLLKNFWESIFDLLTKQMHDTERLPDEVIELIKCLVLLNRGIVVGNSVSNQPCDITDSANEERMKQIVLQFSRCCLNKIADGKSQNCIKHIHSYMDIFAEPGFYKTMTNHSDLKLSIKIFVDLTSSLAKEFYFDMTEIIFKLLHFVNHDEEYEFIKTNLFSVQPLDMQILILENLLSNALISGKQKKILLSGPEATIFIRNITKQSLLKGSITTSAWFERLFVQDEDGNFFVEEATVDALLNDLCEPLQKETIGELNDLCGTVLSQVLPFIFNQKKLFHKTKAKMISTIFQVLMANITNNFLTECTFLKLSSCWTNVLSNENISTEETTLYCTNLVKHMLENKTLTIPMVRKCADVIMRYIMGAVKNSSKTEFGSTELNNLIVSFLSSSDLSPLLEQLYEYCLVLEVISGMVSTKKQFNYKYLLDYELDTIFQRSLLNLFIIKQLNDSDELNALKDSLSTNELNIFNSNICIELQKCMAVLSAGESVLKIKEKEHIFIKVWVKELLQQINYIMCKDCLLIKVLEEKLLQTAKSPHISHCRCLPLLVNLPRYNKYEENATIIFTEETLTYFLNEDALTAAVYFLQYELPTLSQRTITVQKMFQCAMSPSVLIKSAALRYFVIHFFKCYEVTTGDRNIETELLNLFRGISKELHAGNRMLYDVCIRECEFDIVVELVEYMRLLTAMLKNMPWSNPFKVWDDITKGEWGWVSTMLQSIEMFTKPTVALFVVNVCRMFTTFMEFINAEKKISSTSLITETIDEWESVYSQKTYLKIFQTVFALLQFQEKAAVEYFSLLFKDIQQAVMHLDFNVVYNFCKSSSCITPENVFVLLMKNFSNSNITVQRTCFYVLNELTHLYVVDDTDNLTKINSTPQLNVKCKHHIQLFEDFLMAYDPFIEQHVSQFSFKISEIDEFEIIDSQKALGYLFMWDCILDACVKSPLFVRSIYTSWLYERRFFEKFLHFLIRVMPKEVLKNHDTKFITTDIFKCVTWTEINDENLTSERYACHLYTKVLKKLPAVVRKWWNVSPSRQKAFVDKLTTNFVSPLISDEELKSIALNKDHHENMQVTVHLSTREVLAVYFIDEVRTELTLNLPSNYPLGPVRVDCSKNIGGRVSSRSIGMQLALFLTHQNGTILDGLERWKSGLDRKFEGVEECYVCYTIVHHDTCQLPKLTCKTCKKKFHGSCLYKWFTTSSKSTCPICRNVF
ncbi:E3 ubiquitin-protein ligase listerin isoform X2 [Eurosta solidaginis]|uniref:E3 ubiquitin-protein ligase listerin isoform X2 n=1 Tax=Eurosta solidaginis TaxID=178769 RepID=UPI003530EC23